MVVLSGLFGFDLLFVDWLCLFGCFMVVCWVFCLCGLCWLICFIVYGYYELFSFVGLVVMGLWWFGGWCLWVGLNVYAFIVIAVVVCWVWVVFVGGFGGFIVLCVCFLGWFVLLFGCCCLMFLFCVWVWLVCLWVL